MPLDPYKMSLDSDVPASEDVDHEGGYLGHAEDFHVVGRSGAEGQGAHMLLYFHVIQGRVETVHFGSTGCPAANACGRSVTQQATGMLFEDLRKLSATHIVADLGPMPLGREHFPQLTVEALHDALAQAARHSDPTTKEIESKEID